MDQTYVTADGAPKKKWNWLQWTLVGCAGLLVLIVGIGGLGAWLIYRSTNWANTPKTAEAIAQEIMPFEMPAGYHGVTALSTMGLKMAELGPEGEKANSRNGITLRLLPESMSTTSDERQIPDTMRQPDISPAGEVRNVRPNETFEVRGHNVTAHVSMIERKSKKALQYTLTLKNPAGRLVLVIINDSEETATHDWVQHFLSTVK